MLATAPSRWHCAEPSKTHYNFAFMYYFFVPDEGWQYVTLPNLVVFCERMRDRFWAHDS